MVAGQGRAARADLPQRGGRELRASSFGAAHTRRGISGGLRRGRRWRAVDVGQGHGAHAGRRRAGVALPLGRRSAGGCARRRASWGSSAHATRSFRPCAVRRVARRLRSRELVDARTSLAAGRRSAPGRRSWHLGRGRRLRGDVVPHVGSALPGVGVMGRAQRLGLDDRRHAGPRGRRRSDHQRRGLRPRSRSWRCSW
jgi:hypothetical protein